MRKKNLKFAEDQFDVSEIGEYSGNVTRNEDIESYKEVAKMEGEDEKGEDLYGEQEDVGNHHRGSGERIKKPSLLEEDLKIADTGIKDQHALSKSEEYNGDHRSNNYDIENYNEAVQMEGEDKNYFEEEKYHGDLYGEEEVVGNHYNYQESSKRTHREAFAEEQIKPEYKKKQKISERKNLYRPPTVEELNQLRETENLFHSNLFRMQIEEMLKEINIRAKYKQLFSNWLEDFKNILENMKDSKKYNLMEYKLLKKKVKVPIPDLPPINGVFKFIKPATVGVIGSFELGCCLGPSAKIDLKIEIPKEYFGKTDYLNHKYTLKRALYIAYLARKLQKCELVDDIFYSLSCENPLKPILELIPKGKLNKRIIIVVHFSCSFDIKYSRFSPEINNIRPNWLLDVKEEISADKLKPNPHYNSSILQDLVMTVNEEYRMEKLANHRNLLDGIVLLKVWLKQRGLNQGFGCFSGYIMSMFVLYLLQHHNINTAMSSYQITRNVWSSLANSDWTTEGITLANSDNQDSKSIVSNFHNYFEVVFIDVTGHLNLCANMSKETFYKVKHESKLAVKCLDDQTINSFQILFMIYMPFYRQFDHIIKIQDATVIERVIETHSSMAQKLDYARHSYPQMLHLILNVLRRGLGNRVKLIGINLPFTEHWPIEDLPPSFNNTITLGLLLNTETALNILEKGPTANLPEALAFREFWGEKSEIRRFKDGSICETVLWHEGSATISQKRLICKNIVTYLLRMKFGIPKNKVFYIADQLDTLLEQKLRPSDFNNGTGEEATIKIITVFQNLGKQLRELADLPLPVSAVYGTSSVFRYSDVFPHLAYLYPEAHDTFENSSLLPVDSSISALNWIPRLEAIIQLQLSGKWPEDLKAIKYLKAAFYIKLANSLKKAFDLTTQPFPDCILVLKDGFVFHLSIAHKREISLIKETKSATGLIRYRDNEESIRLEKKFMHLPVITSALYGVQQQYPSFGPSCCLAKRWLSAQLLDPFHFPEICVELLVASMYITPGPYHPPNQPQLGFYHFLHLMARTDWNAEPIILNLNSEMTREDISEVENWFRKNRSVLPCLFIATPQEKKISIWTKEAPTLQILIRVAMLATEAIKVLEDKLLLSCISDWKQIFRPSLHIYDIVIHLNTRQNPRHFEAVDANKEDPVKLVAYYKRKKENFPVVGFNPVSCFLEDLRNTYGNHALFFYDVYGGDVITVLWKPKALQPKDFAVSTVNGYKFTKKRTRVELNVTAIVEDFYVLGTGIISSIDIKEKKED